MSCHRDIEQAMVELMMESVGCQQDPRKFREFCDVFGITECAHLRPDGWGIHPQSGLMCVFEAEWSNPLSPKNMSAYAYADYETSGVHLIVMNKWGEIREIEPMAALDCYCVLSDLRGTLDRDAGKRSHAKACLKVFGYNHTKSPLLNAPEVYEVPA